MAKVLEERERYKRERKIPLQHGGDEVGVGVQCGKITERVTLEGGGGAWKDECLPSSPFTATPCMKVVCIPLA